MGLTLAIDDLGTGGSSFADMRQFPLSKFKIDRLFIRESQRLASPHFRLSGPLARVVSEGVKF